MVQIMGTAIAEEDADAGALVRGEITTHDVLGTRHRDPR